MCLLVRFEYATVTCHLCHHSGASSHIQDTLCCTYKCPGLVDALSCLTQSAFGKGKGRHARQPRP
jgi:hypothetical protein